MKFSSRQKINYSTVFQYKLTDINKVID